MPEAFRQGDVVLVPFPYTDLSTAKQRPALVLSNESFNSAGLDVVVCAITSNLRDSERSVLIGPQDMESGVLKLASRVKVGHIATVEKTIVRSKFGRLGKRARSQVMRELQVVFASS